MQDGLTTAARAFKLAFKRFRGIQAHGSDRGRQEARKTIFIQHQQGGSRMSDNPTKQPTNVPPALNVRLRPDRTAVEINIVHDGRPVGGVLMAAPQLDEFIAGLAGARSMMLPEVPHKFPMGQPTHRHESTNYHLGIDPFSGTPCLSFRSPGLGWMTFQIPTEEIENIHRSLQESKGRLATIHTDKKQ